MFEFSRERWEKSLVLEGRLPPGVSTCLFPVFTPSILVQGCHLPCPASHLLPPSGCSPLSCRSHTPHTLHPRSAGAYAASSHAQSVMILIPSLPWPLAQTFSSPHHTHPLNTAPSSTPQRPLAQESTPKHAAEDHSTPQQQQQEQHQREHERR